MSSMSNTERRNRRIKLEMQRNADNPTPGVILWSEETIEDTLSEFTASKTYFLN